MTTLWQKRHRLNVWRLVASNERAWITVLSRLKGICAALDIHMGLITSHAQHIDRINARLEHLERRQGFSVDTATNPTRGKVDC